MSALVYNFCNCMSMTSFTVAFQAFLPLLYQAAEKCGESVLSHKMASVFNVSDQMGSITDNTSGGCYTDVIMTTMASQITSLTVVYSTVYSDADQRNHQSSASLAFVWGIHRDRWIPRTKGQLRGKCFHLMTSSWFMTYIYIYFIRTILQSYGVIIVRKQTRQ